MSFLNRIKDIFMERKKRIWIWPVLSFLAMSLILAANYLSAQVRLQVGDVSRYDIEAPQSMTIIDRFQTEKLQEEVAQKIPNVFEEDERVLAEVSEEIGHFFDLFVEPVVGENLADEEYGGVEMEAEVDKETELTLTASTKEDIYPPDIDNINWSIDEEDFAFLLSLSNEEVEDLRNSTKGILSLFLKQGIRSTHLDDVYEQINDEIKKMTISEKEKSLVGLLARVYLRPNLILNMEATENRRQEARESVEPVKRTVRKGEILVRHGRAVTEEDLLLLSELGLVKPTGGLRNVLGIMAIVLLLMVGSFIYLQSYHESLLGTESTVIFLSLLPIFILALGKLVCILPVNEPGFLVPVSVGSILVAVLLEPQAALFLTIVYSLLAMMIVGGGLPHLVVSLAGGVTGIYSVSKVSQRSDFVRAGFLVGAISGLVILAFSLINEALEPMKILQVSVLGVSNGIIAGILVNGLLPLLEGYMGMTSSVKFVELSHPNEPLLKKLLMEAPGTYHHSVIVGNLAEAAADRLGADSLLARVGAYYHDVGKLKRPYFFSENLLGDSNPHEKLNHSLSALIIKSHVKDGVEMARKYRIPEPIIDIIQQHHGNSVIAFFYQEALQKEGEDVDIKSYSYDGKKPQTKEAALVMLADVVEAAVRSRPDDRTSPQRLEKLIYDLIHERLEQGQLDECDLTLQDIGYIGDCFNTILTGIYHKRIEYPDAGDMREGETDVVTHFNL